MALNPAAVFQQLEMPERPDWQTQVQQGLALKNTGLAVKANKLALQNQEKATRDATALSEAVMVGAGDWAKTRDELAKRGLGEPAMKIDAHIASQTSEKLLQEVRQLDKAIKLAELENAPEKYMWQALKDAAEYRLRNEQAFGAEQTRLNNAAEGQRKADEFAVTGGATGDLGDFRRLTPAASDVTAPAASPDEPTGQLATAPRAKPQTTKEYFDFIRGKKEAESAPPAIIAEYNLYRKEEEAAGRKPDSFDQYATRDANRRKPTTNIFLDKLRENRLEDQETAAPGQVVFAATGRPVQPGQIGDVASARLAGFQSARQQVNVVKEALTKIGSTGAIKGWVLREGVYWPVVQDRITPEQASAVAEVQRLVNGYIYAVSGKQINEQEMERIAKTAPDLRFTSGANEKILASFDNYLKNESDNYLKVRGWKFNEDAAATGSDLSNISTDELLKRLTQ